jgi:periplasmic protein TonB
MQEAVSDILSERARDDEGISRMVAVSVAAHAVLLAAMILMPSGWLSRQAEPEVAPMIISLGGSPGVDAGGRQQESGRTVQERAEPDVTPRPQMPPVTNLPEMTAPIPIVKPTPPKAPPKPVTKPVERSTSRTPTTGAEPKTGAAKADTGAPPRPWQGLTTGGGAGESATTDYANFCCPQYLTMMTTRIKSNWDRNLGAAGLVRMKFVVQRDGRLTDITVERSSGQALLDQAAQRALLMTKQLAPLPREFTEPRLTVYLEFEYQR